MEYLEDSSYYIRQTVFRSADFFVPKLSVFLYNGMEMIMPACRRYKENIHERVKTVYFRDAGGTGE